MEPRVKTEMNRVKLALVALLPALCLVVSGQPLLDFCEGGSHCAGSDAASIFASAKGSCNLPLCSPDSPVHPAHGRFGKNPARSNLFPVEPNSTSSCVLDNSLIGPAPQARPLALAVSWQFFCGAAPLPRAPSHLS